MDTQTIKAVIVIPPEGQRRARSRAWIGAGGKAFSNTYKSDDQEVAEGKLLTLLYDFRPPEPLSGPLVLTVHAFLPIPPSFSKKKAAAALADQIRPDKKPDLSNLIKHLEDVMTGVFWVDDKQIVESHQAKLYGSPARWEIMVQTWQPSNSAGRVQDSDQVGEPEPVPSPSLPAKTLLDFHQDHHLATQGAQHDDHQAQADHQPGTTPPTGREPSQSPAGESTTKAAAQPEAKAGAEAGENQTIFLI